MQGETGIQRRFVLSTLFILLSIFLSVCQFIFIVIYLSICLPVSLSFCLFVCPAVCLSTCYFVHLLILIELIDIFTSVLEAFYVPLDNVKPDDNIKLDDTDMLRPDIVIIIAELSKLKLDMTKELRIKRLYQLTIQVS